MKLVPQPIRYTLSATVIAIATSALVGWFAGPAWLVDWGFGQTIKPVTALALILSACIQFCPRSKPTHVTQLFAVGFAWTLLILLGMVAACLLFGLCDNPAIWTPRPDSATLGYPGQMSHASLVALTALACYGQRRTMNRTTVMLSWLTAGIVGGIGVLAMVGLLADIPSLAFYHHRGSNAVSMPAATCFVLLAVGLFRIR